MKINPKELDKAIIADKLEDGADDFAPAKIVKMHTPDISEKRKSMAIYQSVDPKRRQKKHY